MADRPEQIDFIIIASIMPTLGLFSVDPGDAFPAGVFTASVVNRRPLFKKNLSHIVTL